MSFLAGVLGKLESTTFKLSSVWGLTSGMSQFTMMGMFVQGFWFGSKLVRDGSISAGDVMAVFWACLIATSNLQMCIPQVVTVTKGKFAMAELLSLCEDRVPEAAAAAPPRASTADLVSPTKPSKKVIKKSHRLGNGWSVIRKIAPPKCSGEFALHSVSFSYPSRPDTLVLREVSLFLPAREMTFIVGGSGSGKSTIAQLLMRMYDPTHDGGMISLDDQDMRFLDEGWVRENVAAVSQSCILFDMSVHDNVAMGLASSSSKRRPEDVSREEVVEACRAALMHEFVRDLPEGYETRLGNGGANLSGGQKQRLAIARAKLRDPTVLILGASSFSSPLIPLLSFRR